LCLGQGCCVRDKAAVFGTRLLLFVASKSAVFGQGCCVWDKDTVFWDKAAVCCYAGDKAGMFGTMLLCLGQGCCDWEKAATFGIRLLCLGQRWSVWEKDSTVFGKLFGYKSAVFDKAAVLGQGYCV